MFVNAKSRLPKDLKSVSHKYQVYTEQQGVREVKVRVNGHIVTRQQDYTKNERDSLPRSHTCEFKIDMMEYSSLEIMREKLLYAMKNAEGISD